MIFTVKALQKTFFFVVLCFTKFETIRLSKFETNAKKQGFGNSDRYGIMHGPILPTCQKHN